MPGFYEEMADMVQELLAPEDEDGLGQGVVQLKRVTLGTPPNEWTPAPETVETWPLSATVKRMHQRYENGVLIVETGDMVTFAVPAVELLKLRADTIALHETFSAMGASRDIAFRQQIEAGRVQAQHITKTWRHTPQEHPRAQHVVMHGQVVPFDQPFIAPDGTTVRYPHAPGTPTRHTIGCKCFAEYKIDFVAQLVR
jgi:hypothetical protein